MGTVALAGVLLFLGTGCDKEVKAEKSKDDGSLAVSVTAPKEQPLRRYILQPGIVTSYEETPIYPKLAGYLEDVKVDIGDKVKKGDQLCKIWVPEIEEAVAVKRAKVNEGEKTVLKALQDLRQAEANIVVWQSRVKSAIALVGVQDALRERWEGEYSRDEKLTLNNSKAVATGILDPKTVMEVKHQLEAAKSALAEAMAGEKSAEASLEESKARCEQSRADVKVSEENLNVWRAELREQVAWLSYSKVEAPFDGIITRRIIHTGHFVQPTNSGTTSKAAEPLFVVMRTDLMRVVVQVPEYDAALVKDGAEAIVKLQAYRGQEIKAKVTRSSWALNSDSRTLRVEIFLKNPWDNPKLELEPGMYANVSIAADVPGTLTLPSETILTDGNKDYIFLIENGKATRVNIKKGYYYGRLTEVMGREVPGDKPGDDPKWMSLTGKEQVITSNLKSIQDGQAVKVK